jgi:sporulation protein YlmC with PRC-barrel domain
MNDETGAGFPIAYEALAAGTPVHDRDGEMVGRVKQVLADEEEDVFDGVVIETEHGTRFIDAPDISHISEHRVDLKLTSAVIAAQPKHEESPAMYEARMPSGRLQDLWRRISLRRLWRRDS